MAFHKATHVIFDMDGLLLDTEPIYEDMIRQIVESYNKSYPFDVRMRVMGTTEPITAQILVSELSLPISTDQFLNKLFELSRINLAQANFLKGAERLVRHLHKQKIPICLATSSNEEMVNVKIRKHVPIFDLFNHKVCGSSDPEVKSGKPSPDIFLVAASRFPDNPNPADCLVFEDAPNGVKAARSAGMQVIMVPNERVPNEMRQGATQVLRSLEDFQPEEFGLPSFSS